jgi:hypothetical protein
MRNLLLGVMIVANAEAAFAQDQAFICYYNSGGDFTAVEKAPATSKVGEVSSSGYSGGKAYSYVVSARVDTACPNQVPLGTKYATTGAIVRQDSTSCTNDDISSAEPALLGGSVTVYRASSRSKGVNVHLVAATSPDTSYGVFIKCGEKLGTLKTDAKGRADQTFNFRTDGLGTEIAFEIVPEGGAGSGKLESVQIKN